MPTAQEVIAKYLSVVGANRQDILSQAIVMPWVVFLTRHSSLRRSDMFIADKSLRIRHSVRSAMFGRSTFRS